MSHLYSVSLNSDGLAIFTTEIGDIYTAYFLEYPLQDDDGNEQIVYNFDFLCNDSFEYKKFTKKHDIKVKNTLISIIEQYFANHEEAVIVYFCFNGDGYGRHRSVAFRAWLTDLSNHIDKVFKSVNLNDVVIYSCMLISKHNPLKKLILDAFEQRLADLTKINQ